MALSLVLDALKNALSLFMYTCTSVVAMGLRARSGFNRPRDSKFELVKFKFAAGIQEFSDPPGPLTLLFLLPHGLLLSELGRAQLGRRRVARVSRAHQRYCKQAQGGEPEPPPLLIDRHAACLVRGKTFYRYNDG